MLLGVTLWMSSDHWTCAVCQGASVHIMNIRNQTTASQILLPSLCNNSWTSVRTLAWRQKLLSSCQSHCWTLLTMIPNEASWVLSLDASDIGCLLSPTHVSPSLAPVSWVWCQDPVRAGPVSAPGRECGHRVLRARAMISRVWAEHRGSGH